MTFDNLLSGLIGAIIGGALTVVGGIWGTVLLARLEDARERKRQRERHATAVRIVVLELQGIGAAHVMYAYAGSLRQLSTAGYEGVAADLYSLLPEDLAGDVAFVYSVVRDPGSPQGAELVANRVISVLQALRTYGDRELGLKFQSTGTSKGGERGVDVPSSEGASRDDHR